MENQTLQTNTEKNVSEQYRHYFNMKGIGPKSFPFILKFFENMSFDDITIVLRYPSYLYYFFFYLNIDLPLNIVNFLFQYSSKANLKKIIQNISNKRINLSKKDDNEIQKIFISLTKDDCSLSNFFLQDIFHPELIFKSKYTPFNFDVFATSFYYLMNCSYPKQDFPLNVRMNNYTDFKFPFDIEYKEWNRPIIIVDVQNVLQEGNIIINGKHVATATFQQRKKAILNHKQYILQKVFEKHNEVNTMILFVTQSDNITNPRRTCLNIVNLHDQQTNRVIVGTPSEPLNRVALFIEVPCNIFTYTKDGFDGDYRYSKFGELLQIDPYNGRLYNVTNPHNKHIVADRLKPYDRDARDKNQFINHVKADSKCSDHLGKNELDDYLIGIILLLSKKANNECYKLLLQYKPIVFTHDRYNWMRSELKESFINPNHKYEHNDSRKRFFDYIEDSGSSRIRNFTIHRENYKFWLEMNNSTQQSEPITSDLIYQTQSICSSLNKNLIKLKE